MNDRHNDQGNNIISMEVYRERLGKTPRRIKNPSHEFFQKLLKLATPEKVE